MRRRAASLAGAVLVFVAAVVVELTALVAATASAARNPVTADVTADSGGTVTPINLVTNTPGTPIPLRAGSGTAEIVINKSSPTQDPDGYLLG